MNDFEDVRVLPRFTEREGVKLTELSGKFNMFVLAQVLVPKKDDLALQQGSPDEISQLVRKILFQANIVDDRSQCDT